MPRDELRLVFQSIAQRTCDRQPIPRSVGRRSVRIAIFNRSRVSSRLAGRQMDNQNLRRMARKNLPLIIHTPHVIADMCDRLADIQIAPIIQRILMPRQVDPKVPQILIRPHVIVIARGVFAARPKRIFVKDDSFRLRRPKDHPPQPAVADRQRIVHANLRRLRIPKHHRSLCAGRQSPSEQNPNRGRVIHQRPHISRLTQNSFPRDVSRSFAQIPRNRLGFAPVLPTQYARKLEFSGPNAHWHQCCINPAPAGQTHDERNLPIRPSHGIRHGNAPQAPAFPTGRCSRKWWSSPVANF